jgi:hypothetical protein
MPKGFQNDGNFTADFAQEFFSHLRQETPTFQVEHLRTPNMILAKFEPFATERPRRAAPPALE